jgi:hypothetical protein
MRACEVMMLAKKKTNELYHATWEGTGWGPGDMRGERRGRGAGGDADGGEKGIGYELVTKPKGKHAQQNLKNVGQNEPATAK